MPFNNQPTWSDRPTAYDAISGLVDSIQGRQQKAQAEELARQRSLMQLYAQDPGTAERLRQTNPEMFKGFNAPAPEAPDPFATGAQGVRQAALERIQAGHGTPADYALVYNLKEVGTEPWRKGFGQNEVLGNPTAYPQGTVNAVGIENKTVISPEEAAKNKIAADAAAARAKAAASTAANQAARTKIYGQAVGAQAGNLASLTASRNAETQRRTGMESHAVELEKQASLIERHANGVNPVTGQQFPPETRSGMLANATELRTRARTIRQNAQMQQPQQQAAPAQPIPEPPPVEQPAGPDAEAQSYLDSIGH